MRGRQKRKTSQNQRQRLRYRLLIAGAISLCAAGTGFLLWMQLSKPEDSRAAVTMELNQDNLPSEMNVSAMIVAPADTTTRGMRCEIAKPLSQTPVYTAP